LIRRSIFLALSGIEMQMDEGDCERYPPPP